MKRREFSRGLITTGLAAPALIRPDRSWSNQPEDDGRTVEQFARLQLFLGGPAIVVTWMIIMLPVLLGLDFRRTIPRYALARAALGVLLLGLQRAPVTRRFADPLLFGTIYLIGTLLVILPLLDRFGRLGRTSVAHREYEYGHPGRLREVKIDGLPSPAQLARLEAIGEVYLNDKGELVLVIDPVDEDLPFRRPSAEIQRLGRREWSDF